MAKTRILGIDPGLRITGWGIIEIEGSRLSHVAHGTVCPKSEGTMGERLNHLYQDLLKVIDLYRPHEAAIEEVFMNTNPLSTLKLGMARGVAMLAPAERGLKVSEYGANKVKKSVVGSGHASKEQMAAMVKILLPGCAATQDAADALGVAICHSHHRTFQEIEARS